MAATTRASLYQVDSYVLSTGFVYFTDVLRMRMHCFLVTIVFLALPLHLSFFVTARFPSTVPQAPRQSSHCDYGPRGFAAYWQTSDFLNASARRQGIIHLYREWHMLSDEIRSPLRPTLTTTPTGRTFSTYKRCPELAISQRCQQADSIK